jgi:cobalt/nickel transport protein
MVFSFGGKIMKFFVELLLLVCMFLIVTITNTFAHFGMVIPSDNMVMQDDTRKINIVLSFSHPFEKRGMALVKPAEFYVMKSNRKESLLNDIKITKVMGEKAWQTEFAIKRPGVYSFCMIPRPYWEPSEDCYIVHYTRTVVTAFGDDEGWDREIGLKTEIVPLSKPFGLYKGNLFQGIVKLDKKAVPYAEVEIEYYNEDGKAKAPTDYMITQTIKADKNGVFSYAVPKSGWWGFAALNTSEEKMKYKGEDKEIEIGAVLWVKFEDFQD